MDTGLINQIQEKLYNLRGIRVMLDKDLAEYYKVEVRSLNQAVKRNIDLFPEDFMFQLTDKETKELKSRGILKQNVGNPYAFTEKGAWISSFILRSERSRFLGIQLIRILERLRDFGSTHQELMGPSIKDQITNPTSVTNVFYAPVTIQQQGNQNQLNINQAELILELMKIKSSVNSTLSDKLDKVIESVARGDKESAMKTVKSITDVAKAGSALFKVGTHIATLISPWLG